MSRLTYWAAPLGFLRWAVLLLPLYTLLQGIPLPRGLIQILSPARIASASAGERFVTLSVQPDASCEHALEFAACAIVFLVAREFVYRARARVWLVTAPLLLIAGIESAWGLSQAAGSGFFAVAHGSYANRNHLAGLLEMVLPFAAMFALAGLRSGTGLNVSPFRAFQVCAGAGTAALIVGALLRTQSRMGLISTLFSAVLLAIVATLRRTARGWRRWRAPAAAGLLALVTVLWLLPAELIERMANLSAGDFSMAERLRLWRESLPLLRDFPVFGCGVGAYAAASADYRDDALKTVDHAHNDYLEYLIELGPVIFVVALGCVALILFRLFRSVRRLPRGDVQLVAVATAGALAAILLHGLADFNLHVTANIFVFAWIGGIAAGINALAATRTAQRNHYGDRTWVAAPPSAIRTGPAYREPL